jgi:hypothetical protein
MVSLDNKIRQLRPRGKSDVAKSRGVKELKCKPLYNRDIDATISIRCLTHCAPDYDMTININVFDWIIQIMQKMPDICIRTKYLE